MIAGGASLSVLARVAWRNLWRHKRRSLITASAMAVALAMCLAMIAITDGMFSKMFEVLVEQQLGHAQVHHPDYPAKKVLYDTIADVSDVLATVDGVEGTVAAAPRLNGFALVGGASDSAGGQLVGIDPARERLVGPLAERVEVGAFLDDAPAREALVGIGLAEELRVGVGDEIVVVTQASDGSMGNDVYRVRGVVKTGATLLDRGGVWLHLADLQELLVLPDQAHGIQLLTTDADAVPDYAARVREAVGDERRHVQAWWEVSPQTAEMMEMRDASAVIVLGLVFVVAAFGIANTMMMSVFERTRELGVLKAIGLRPGRMVLLIVIESVFLAAVAAAIGLVLGGAIDLYLVTKGMIFSASAEEGMSFLGVTFDPVIKGEVRADGVITTVVALFLVTVLASLWPAARAARLRPVEAIRSE